MIDLPMPPDCDELTTPAIFLALLVAPLVLLAGVNRLVGRTLFDAPSRGCIGLALVFCFTGVDHFLQTEPMAGKLPAWVPARFALVYVTGVIELALALAVLVPRLRGAAGWAIIVMLVLFLPVNIYAALNHVGMGGYEWGPVYLLIRVPLQAILIGWTWWFAVRPAAAKPIAFTCRATLPIEPEEIARRILDLDRWPEFQGYAVLPGIKAAQFEVRTPQVVGTRFRVTDSYGSTHVEEIVEWQPERRLVLRMYEFSPPLSLLAAAFDETWEFERIAAGTRVLRSFALHAQSTFTRPLLWPIAFLLKRAIARHLREMRN